jgi:hypothetical protein
VTLAEFRQRIVDQRLLRFFDYWLRIRGDRFMPAWGDIRPEEIAVSAPLWRWRAPRNRYHRNFLSSADGTYLYVANDIFQVDWRNTFSQPRHTGIAPWALLPRLVPSLRARRENPTHRPAPLCPFTRCRQSSGFITEVDRGRPNCVVLSPTRIRKMPSEAGNC